MNEIKLVQKLYIDKGIVVNVIKNPCTLYDSGLDLCQFIANYGADIIYIKELAKNLQDLKTNLEAVKNIIENSEIPVILGGSSLLTADVIDDFFNTGASMLVVDSSKPDAKKVVTAITEKYGSGKVAIKACPAMTKAMVSSYKDLGASFIIKSVVSKDDEELDIPIMYADINGAEADAAASIRKMYHKNVIGFIFVCQSDYLLDYMILKLGLKNDGISVKLFEPKIEFSQLKLNNDGLIPVIIQDYKTNEVLMLAYMNEQAYKHTLQSGRMTYFSRSRNELWEKGLTSGHFQYVKEIYADCDKDTILAKVYQTGAACHTGSRSCFFNEIAKKDF